MFIKNEDMVVLYRNKQEENRKEYIATRDARIENYLKEYGYKDFDGLVKELKNYGIFKFSLPVKGKYMKTWKSIAEEIKSYFQEKGYWAFIERNNNPNRKWISYRIEIIVRGQ